MDQKQTGIFALHREEVDNLELGNGSQIKHHA
jgi:hypothetical protein